MPTKSETSVVKSTCSMCQCHCGIDAHIKDGKLIKVTPMREHPFNKLCVKAQGIVDWLYSPERITNPLRKRGNTWEKISWGEAFDIIGDKLFSLKENYGAKTLVVYYGNAFVGTYVGRVVDRFCGVYGTPNITSGGSLCFAARAMGNGLSLNNRMMVLVPSYSDTKCMVIWGRNPTDSNANEAVEISRARKGGARLIVIDPRTTKLAKESDLHVKIKPGTDCALALGLLNVIIAEGLYDRAFVEQWTVGFDKLKEHVKKYSPEVIEKITWVPAETIRQVARIYATGKPATISQGEALDHCINGVQTGRAISILVAITGNLDISGGNIYQFPLRQASLRVKGIVSVDEAIGIQYPFFGKFTGMTTVMPVSEAIITQQPYPIKALIVQGSNPVLTWPNTNKIKQAFSQLDLLVVSDLFMTETAKLADIFLPATTFLERKTLLDYGFEGGLPLVAMSNKVVEPPDNCLDDWQIWSELGRKMGYADYFPWQSIDELLSYLLEPSGITLEQLEQNPGGLLYYEITQRKYAKEGLNTPSGKVEIFSQTMQDYGYDPLPTFTEPADDKAKLAKSYPFILTTGARVIAFTHSRYRDIARLRRLVPYPTVEINTSAAQNLGIADGDQVIVESPKGSIKLRAKITDDIHPKVISLQHGWDEANANILSDDEERDPISGYPPFRTILCRVMKAEG